MMRRLLITTLLLTAPLAAQNGGAASSETYFLSSSEQAAGGVAETALYHHVGAQGAGIVPEPCSESATYVLEGGFVATLDAPTTGRPWATGVLEPFVGQVGGGIMVVQGTELDLGPTPSVTVAGQPAVVTARDVHAIKVVQPPLPVPGYHEVTISGAFGATTLPKGVGVLPLIEAVCPVVGDVAWGFRYRGAPGDSVLLLLSTGTTVTPFTLPGFGYSLQLDPGLLIELPVFGVSSPDGIVEFVFPPTPLTDMIVVQGLALSFDPGFAPGSFTNVLDF